MKTFRSVNQLFGFAVFEKLRRLGVRDVFIAPGSRSTPLVLGAVEAGMQTHVHFDERGLGFFALGHAKSTGRAVAIVTTSGTAVSNLLPALTEAFHSYVPLLVMSADRPDELRNVGSNQAINQVGLFKNASVADAEMPTPGLELDLLGTLDFLETQYAKAFSLSGPVHLNFPFREPLAPPISGSIEVSKEIHAWIAQAKSYVTVPQARDDLSAGFTPKLTSMSSRRPLIIMSQGLTAKDELAVRDWAHANSIPVFADVLSVLRSDRSTLKYADWFVEGMEAEADDIFWFGGVLQSKRLRGFLQQSKARIHQVLCPRRGPEQHDDMHLPKTVIQTHSISNLLESLTFDDSEDLRVCRKTWLSMLTGVNEKANQFLTDKLVDLSEPAIARTLAQNLPTNGFLMSGSSRPIRDLEAFADNWPGGSLYSNRGASGIDGNIATFAGLCEGLQKPGALLIGDIATLHDLNSLALMRQQSLPSLIVLVDNDGGGIFHFLPVHDATEHFEKYFGTPHGVDLNRVIRAFDLRVDEPKSLQEFSDMIRQSFKTAGTTVLRLRTNRDSNLQLHRSLREEWNKWSSFTDS